MPHITLASLTKRVAVLEAEAEIRRIQARYMFLCDTPCPDPSITDDYARIDAILELYTDDAVWEGVGEYYTGQFGHAEGKDQIRRHFLGFWRQDNKPTLVLNAHYLTSEQIHVDADNDIAAGQWIHMQPWVFSDGTTLLRSSRLNNSFRKEKGTWHITRTRTENVFIANLPKSFMHTYPSSSELMRD